MGAELTQAHIDVGIVTNDRTGALAFWNGLFGFPIEGEVSFPGLTIVRLKVGNAILRLCIPDTQVGRKAESGAFDAETGLRYLTLAIGNLDALVAAARAAGYPIPVEPREIRPGVRAAQIQDGQGVTVELMETAAS